MRPFLTVSVILHLALMLFLWLGLPDFGEELPIETSIAVGLVADEPSDVTEPPAPPAAEAAPLPERDAASKPPPPPEPPAPEPPPREEAAPPPPAEPVTEPLVADEPVIEPVDIAEPSPPTAPAMPLARPEPPAPRPDPQPEQALEPEQQAEEEPLVAETAPTAPAIPRRRPDRPQPPEEPPTSDVAEAEPADSDQLDALLRSVEDLTKRVRADEAREGSGSAETEPSLNDQGETASQLAARQNALAAAAAQAMRQCWRLPAGVRGVGEMQPFEVNVRFGQDARAEAVEIVDRARLARDPTFRVVAESAQRAAWSCELSLPPEMYDVWRNMTFVFDPQRAISG